MGSDVGKPFTKVEINTLVSMWPNASVAQIAGRLHRPYGSILAKAKQLRAKGFLLEANNTPRSRLPDPQDFDEVKMSIAASITSPLLNSAQGSKKTTGL
jgi:hypothetical protein